MPAISKPRYFYSELKQEGVCLRFPQLVENIELSTGNPEFVKIAHYNDQFMYNLLLETWEGMECTEGTYLLFKDKVLQALQLVAVDKSN